MLNLFVQSAVLGPFVLPAAAECCRCHFKAGFSPPGADRQASPSLRGASPQRCWHLGHTCNRSPPEHLPTRIDSPSFVALKVLTVCCSDTRRYMLTVLHGSSRCTCNGRQECILLPRSDAHEQTTVAVQSQTCIAAANSPRTCLTCRWPSCFLTLTDWP